MDPAEVLFRAASRRLLAALGEAPTSLTELSAKLGVTKPALVRALAPLEQLGVVERSVARTPQGQVSLYRRLPFSVAWTMTHGFSLSWFSPGEVPIRDMLLHQLPPGAARDDVQTILDEVHGLPIRLAWSVRFIIVFGSVARGQATWKSDVDVMFLLAGHVDEARAKLQERLADATTRMTHAPSPHFATVDEFLNSQRSLHAAIREEGVIVRGETNHPAPEVSVWRQLKRYASTST